MSEDKNIEATELEDSLLDDAELDATRGGVDFAALLGSKGRALRDLQPDLRVLRPNQPIGPNASYITEIITDGNRFDRSVLDRATTLLRR